MKRSLALFLAVMMLLSAATFTTLAEDEPEIVTAATADELTDAIAKNTGKVIKLTADITFNEKFSAVYNEKDGLIHVSANGAEVATVGTGEKSTSAGKVASGSLGKLTRWVPLANLNGNTLDGDGHKISGMFIFNKDAFVSSVAANEAIKNITFENAVVISNANKVAPVVSQLFGTIENVHVKSSFVYSSASAAVGGVVAYTEASHNADKSEETASSLVNYCSFDGKIMARRDAANAEAGGIVGQARGSKIINCVNYGDVMLVTGTTCYGVGGILGLDEPTFGSYNAKFCPINSYILNCANYGKITATENDKTKSGGIVGYSDPWWSTKGSIIYTNLYDAGSASSETSFGNLHQVGGTNCSVDLCLMSHLFVTGKTPARTTSGGYSLYQQIDVNAEAKLDDALAGLNAYVANIEGAYAWKKVDGKIVPDPKETVPEATLEKDPEPEGPPHVADIKEDEIRDITVTSVKVANEKQLIIELSEEIQLVGDNPANPVFSGIRYIYADKNSLAYNDSTPMQMYGSLLVDGNKLIWTSTGGPLASRSLADVLAKKGYEDKDWRVAFCFEGLPAKMIPNPFVNYVNNVRSVSDEFGILKGNAPNPGAPNYCGLYLTDIQDVENATLSYAEHMVTNFRDITVEKIRYVDCNTIELTFSEDIQFVGSRQPFMCIRYTNNEHWVQYENGDTSKPLQWSGNGVISGNKLTWVKGNKTKTFADIFNKVGYEEIAKDYNVEFCIEGVPDADGKITSPMPGYIDNIQSLDGKGMLVATKVAGDGIYDGWLTGDIDEIENRDLVPEATKELNITEMHILNDKQIEFTFDSEVKLVGTNSSVVFSAIRYMDSEGKNLMYYNKDDGTEGGASLPGGSPMQFTGKVEVEGNKIIWTSNGATVGELLALKGYEDKNWKPMFCFEEMPDKGTDILAPEVGFVDNIQSLDGKAKLKATKPNNSGCYDGWYSDEFLDMENINKKYIPGGLHEIHVEKIEIINERQIQLTCSEDVKLVGSSAPFSALRYTFPEGHGVVYYSETDKKDRSGPADGYKPMQYSGQLSIEGNVITWTKNPGLLSFEDFFNKKGYEKYNWLPEFCIEGMPDTSGAITNPAVGLLDNIQSLDGKGMLEVTRNGGGVYDGWLSPDVTGIENAKKKYIPVVVRPVWEEDDRPGVELLSATILNESQIQLKFSAPVKLNGDIAPFMAIRYVTYDSNGRPNYGTYKTKEGKTGVMQISGSVDWSKGGSTVIWNKGGGDSMKDIINMKAFDGNGKYGYDIMFCIEGMPNAKLKNRQLAYIDNIVSKDGKEKLKGLLVAYDGAKLPDGSWRAEYDGLYVPIGGTQNAGKKWEPPYHANVTLDKIEVINAFQMQLTFSEPIKLVGTSNPVVFSAIRYTDDQNNVIKHPTASYLQWMGDIATNDTNVVKWTLRSSNSKTLSDLFKMSGYENDGYKMSFCIEGMPDNDCASPVVGYIDNIQSLDGTKLLKANKFDTARGIYDGLYFTDIENMDKADVSDAGGGVRVGVEVESVTITGNYQIEVKFSEPVRMIGEGTAATQYCPVNAAIRFTDANLNVQMLDGKYLEFAGDFVIDEGTDIGYWDMRNQTQTIKQILMNRDYADFQATFCIEGTADDVEFPSPQPGYVDNIQNMDGSMLLVATKSDMFGVADAFYTTDIIEQEKDPDADRVVIDTANMTNEEREAYNATEEAARKAKLEEAIALVKGAKAGELTEAGQKAFDKLLSANDISANDVNAYLVGMDGTVDMGGYPVTLTYDVSEKEFDMNDKIFVYRVNEDGTVTKLDRVTATVANGKIKNVKFMTDKISDFIITNKDLSTESGSGLNPWVLGGAGAAVVAAGAIIAIILGKKKKKKED